jgi:pimeloyl-ACP methyl ester carboxylesterase
MTTAGHRGGTGTPVLLLHGVGGTWQIWSSVLPLLEPHHDVIAPTLPGHGGGPHMEITSALSIETLADALVEELDRMGVAKAHIVGNSLGGWLAIELARRGRASSLVLFSPAGAWKSQRSIELRAAAIRGSHVMLRRLAPYAGVVAAVRPLRWLLLAAQVRHPDRVPVEVLAALIRATGAAPVVMPLVRALPRHQVEPLADVGDYPVRLVWADKDRVLPFAGFGAPMLERLPGAELRRLSNTGHIPMFDDPVAVAAEILAVTGLVDNPATP